MQLFNAGITNKQLTMQEQQAQRQASQQGLNSAIAMAKLQADQAQQALENSAITHGPQYQSGGVLKEDMYSKATGQYIGTRNVAAATSTPQTYRPELFKDAQGNYLYRSPNPATDLTGLTPASTGTGGSAGQLTQYQIYGPSGMMEQMTTYKNVLERGTYVNDAKKEVSLADDPASLRNYVDRYNSAAATIEQASGESQPRYYSYPGRVIPGIKKDVPPQAVRLPIDTITGKPFTQEDIQEIANIQGISVEEVLQNILSPDQLIKLKLGGK